MYIASISSDLKIHSWPNGQLVHTYKSNLQGCSKSISWSKDGSWLVLVPSKGFAEIISVRDNLKHLHSIQDIQQPTCAAFQTTTKRNIALGTTTGTVLVYDIKSKAVRKHFPRASSTVFDIQYCVKDSFMVAGCESGELLLYNSVNYNLSASYKIPKSKTLSTIRCHSTKRNFISGGSQEGYVAVWDIHANKLAYSVQAHAAIVSDLTFSPLRHDLIVTVGMDRKLAFYDMTEKNCLIQKVLETSATAVDFCPDGVGIAVALHDGSIISYDSRQLNLPLYKFKAHNYPIKQVKFQKSTSEISNTDYTFNDSTDSADEAISPASLDKSKRSFDSLAHMFCGDVLPDIPEIPPDCCSELDGGDSFLDAIGMNSNMTANSARESIASVSESLKKFRESKLNILENNSRNSPISKSKHDISVCFQDIQRRISETFIPNKGLEQIKVQDVSTPKTSLQNPAPQMFVSPIVTSSNTNAELVKIVRDVVRQEMKDVLRQEMEIMQQQLKYDFMDVIAQMRRHFLDLQISIVKEFVQMESSISKIKVDYSGDEGFGEECLIQENIKLRKELASLREQTVTNSDEI